MWIKSTREIILSKRKGMSGDLAAPLSLSLLFQDVGQCLLRGGGGVIHVPADSSSQAAPSRGDRPLLNTLLILSSAKAAFPDIGSNFLGCRTDALEL